MDQPASYTKIIPQLMLPEREEVGGGREKQYYQPHPSRLWDTTEIIPFLCVHSRPGAHFKMREDLKFKNRTDIGCS
jgi:hypothetical protein